MNAVCLPVIADVGRRGHRHLHVRLLVERVLATDEKILERLWFYLQPGTVRAVAEALAPAAAIRFRARVLEIERYENCGTLERVIAVACDLGAAHLLFLDIDPFIYELVWRSLPIPVSGVWFRPNFHYSEAGYLHEGLRQRVTALVKGVVARALCGREAVRRIFVLDACAAEYATRHFAGDKIRFLPDPLAFPTKAGLKAVSVPGDRRVFAIVGAISRRKGILSILGALRHLTPAIQRRVELRIVGCAMEFERAMLVGAINRTRESTLAKVSWVDSFVSDEAIDLAIVQSDVLLLLYQRFIGSSGLMIRAALHGRPVVATRYGLIGAAVRRHCLGITIDPYDQERIALSITQAVSGDLHYDAPAAQRFAAMYSPEHYVSGLYELIVA